MQVETMWHLLENHPVLALLGVFGGLARFVLEITAPEYASVFGAAVGIPLTGMLVKDHLALKRRLRAEGLIR
jgi:hypothetical protein